MSLSVFRALACMTYPTPTPFGVNTYVCRDFKGTSYQIHAPTVIISWTLQTNIPKALLYLEQAHMP